jgi:hypothetical protein
MDISIAVMDATISISKRVKEKHLSALSLFPFRVFCQYLRILIPEI